MHGKHSFVVTGDAGFEVPLHVDLALVEHLYSGPRRVWKAAGGVG